MQADEVEAEIGRIRDALTRASAAALGSRDEALDICYKGAGREPVTRADKMVNTILREGLCRPGEAWLSEEDEDDEARSSAHRVWIVDPIDGTKEFIQGNPEWSISVALVQDGVAIVAGVSNPSTGEMFLGGQGVGLQVTKQPTPTRARCLVLASRTEFADGKWSAAENPAYKIQPMGSVAYKLARVAAGLADATWTVEPKHEWDIAGGICLVAAAGGILRTRSGPVPALNQPHPWLPNLFAFSAATHRWLEPLAFLHFDSI